MKKVNKAGLLMIRVGLFAVLAIVQLILIYINRFQPTWYQELCHAMIGVCCGAGLVFILSLFIAEQKSYCICIFLDCVGVAASLLPYWRFITTWGGDNFNELEKFIMGPYLVCAVCSCVVWQFIHKTVFNVSAFVHEHVGKHKRLIRNSVTLLLTACSVVFFCVTLYFVFALHNGLFAALCSLITVLAFFSSCIWKKAAAD